MDFVSYILIRSMNYFVLLLRFLVSICSVMVRYICFYTTLRFLFSYSVLKTDTCDPLGTDDKTCVLYLYCLIKHRSLRQKVRLVKSLNIICRVICIYLRPADIPTWESTPTATSMALGRCHCEEQMEYIHQNDQP